jgi:hypothetical protein
LSTPKSSVGNKIKKYNKSGTVENNYDNFGAPKKYCLRDIRHLLLIVDRYPHTTLFEIRELVGLNHLYTDTISKIL